MRMSRGEAYGGLRITCGLLIFYKNLREITTPSNERDLIFFTGGFYYGNVT